MIDRNSLLELADTLEDGAREGNANFFFHHATHSDGTIVISGDQGALREFAGKIIRLLASSDDGIAHCHFGGAAFSEASSQPMIVARTEEREQL